MVHYTRVISMEVLACRELSKCYNHEICLRSFLQVRRKVEAKNSLENYVYSLRNTLRDDKVRHRVYWKQLDHEIYLFDILKVFI